MARQQFRKHNTTTNKEQMARQQMMTQSNAFPSMCHDATPWCHQISLPHFSVPPLTPPDFFSPCPGATRWRHWVQFQHTQALKCYKFTCSNYVSCLSSCAFVVRASCAEFWFQFVVVIGSCHLLFFCCRFLLSCVVCGCDSHLFYCLRHFRLSTLFAFVCTCVRTCVAGGFQSH